MTCPSAQSAEGLRSLIRDWARESFKTIQIRRADERFYAFALYTDDGAMTVCAAASTEESFQRRLQNDAEQEHSFDAVAYAREYRSDEASDHRKFLRWATTEWEYAGFDVPEHEELHAAMSKVDLWEIYGREGVSRPLTYLTRLMTDVLADLDREGAFGVGAERERVVLFVSVADSDACTFIENRSAKRLNPAPMLSEYLDRLPRSSVRGYLLLDLPELVSWLFRRD